MTFKNDGLTDDDYFSDVENTELVTEQSIERDREKNCSNGNDGGRVIRAFSLYDFLSHEQRYRFDNKEDKTSTMLRKTTEEIESNLCSTMPFHQKISKETYG